MQVEKREPEILHIEEVRELIIKEKGVTFWDEFIGSMEDCQRDYYVEGYRYAIRILEDGLIKRN